jgi:hypothetical protein
MISATPIAVTVNGQQGSSFPYTIAAHASVHLDAVDVTTLIKVGSIIVTPAAASSSPLAQALFSFTQNGITLTQAAVPARPAAMALRMYVENLSIPACVGCVPVQQGAGLAIVNSTTAPTTVSVEVFDHNGVSTGLKTTFAIPSLGHVGKLLNDLFPASPQFSGIARITSDRSPIVITALLAEYNERGEFVIAATPASDENSVPSTSQTMLPLIAVGGAPSPGVGSPQDGYSMGVLLLSGSAGESAAGIASFSKQNGQALNLFRFGP